LSLGNARPSDGHQHPRLPPGRAPLDSPIPPSKHDEGMGKQALYAGRALILPADASQSLARALSLHSHHTSLTIILYNFPARQAFSICDSCLLKEVSDILRVCRDQAESSAPSRGLHRGSTSPPSISAFSGSRTRSRQGGEIASLGGAKLDRRGLPISYGREHLRGLYQAAVGRRT